MDLKYPRTYHLPTSPGLASDDRRLPSLDVLRGRRVIVTEKADGEGTTMTSERTYPRSIDGRSHPSRDWMKAHHARKAHEIPPGWRISGEYLYARHSIAYTREAGNALRSYFYGFGVWDAENRLIDWDQTMEVFALLDIEPVTLLYDGPFSESQLERIARDIDPLRQEGFVIRDAGALDYPSGKGDAGRFFRGLAKWVRKGHVQSDQHWATSWRDEPEFRNELKEGISPIP